MNDPAIDDSQSFVLAKLGPFCHEKLETEADTENRLPAAIGFPYRVAQTGVIESLHRIGHGPNAW
jgi:hypothetical protein